MHSYQYVFGDDGDYIVLASIENGEWVYHTAWLIPNSQIED